MRRRLRRSPNLVRLHAVNGAEADVELPLVRARSFAIQQQEPYQQQITLPMAV